MTSITWEDYNDDLIITAVGHATGDDEELGGKICAVTTSTLMTLWTVTLAEGEWRGPEGGYIRLRITDARARSDSLLFALLALFAFSGEFSSYIEMIIKSKLVKNIMDDFEKRIPANWTSPMLQKN